MNLEVSLVYDISQKSWESSLRFWICSHSNAACYFNEGSCKACSWIQPWSFV